MQKLIVLFLAVMVSCEKSHQSDIDSNYKYQLDRIKILKEENQIFASSGDSKEGLLLSVNRVFEIFNSEKEIQIFALRSAIVGSNINLYENRALAIRYPDGRYRYLPGINDDHSAVLDIDLEKYMKLIHEQ